MRWRLTDRIQAFDPWRSATGLKAVSLEEYDLLLPLGREGELPEGLVLETSVSLLRWLVMASSEFRSTCVLDDVESFEFTGTVRVGDVITIRATVLDRQPDTLRASCEMSARGIRVACGCVTARLVPLCEYADVEMLSGTWSEIYVPA